MKQAALAIIDALGFKGIWKRAGVSGEAVLAKMRALAEATDQALDADFPGDSGYRQTLSENPQNAYELVQCAFLSDTVVYAVANKSVQRLAEMGWDPELMARIGPDWPPYFNARNIGAIAAYVASTLALSTRDDPVLAFRGAISFGDFEVDHEGRFIVGEAVDDAAEHHELAQGAFVWLAPRALEVFLAEDQSLGKRAGEPPSVWPEHLIRYDVPLKGGLSFETYAVSPFGAAKSHDECDAVRDRILSSFKGGSLDVALKRQLTQRFLAAARDAWRSAPAPDAARRTED